jgi:hypothetical protein
MARGLTARTFAVWCLVAAGGGLSITAPAAAGPSHPGGVDDTCDEVLSGSPGGELAKETDPPDGSRVQPGDEITVRLRWPSGFFADRRLHKVLDCVTVDGRLLADASIQERDTANDGEFTHTYRIPGDAAPGTRVCDRGFVSGDGSGGFERQKSNDVCFEVVAPAGDAAPTPPLALDTGQEERAPLAPPPPPAPTEPPMGTTLTDRMPAKVDTLPVTGSPRRPLMLLAGLALAAGGALLVPARPTRRRP